MDSFDVNSTGDVVVWLLLLTAPYWLPLVGGYIELGSRVVVLGLAAMALNFLLGYTGVLSFGHAAYFGLGAYGAAMTIRYLVPSTRLGLLVGVLVGTIAAAIIGPLIVAPARRLFRHGARSPSARCSISSPSAGTRSPAATTG